MRQFYPDITIWFPSSCSKPYRIGKIVRELLYISAKQFAAANLYMPVYESSLARFIYTRKQITFLFRSAFRAMRG